MVQDQVGGSSRHELAAQGADLKVVMSGAEVSVNEYVEWVQAGGGDFWTKEDDKDE